MTESAADIVIVGGGAAGLTAAIFAAETVRKSADAGRRVRVVVLDGAKKLGAKILVAGGGRCNVTHERVRPEDYQGPRPVVRNVLAAFNEQATVRWMASMGVELKREETGKLFPVSDEAQTVLDAMLRRCDELGVELRTDHRVTQITREAEGAGEAGQVTGFTVHHSHGEVAAGRVILATGGKSLPRSGSDGFGYGLARSLGHSVTATYPALVPLVLEEGFFHAELSGIAVEVELATYVGGKVVDRRRGAMLWTHFGVSGPVVMDASRFWTMGRGQGSEVEVRCSLLPGETFEAVDAWLAGAGGGSLLGVIGERLPRRVAEAVVRGVEVGGSAGAEAGRVAMAQLSRAARREVVHRLVNLRLPVVRDRGWNYAEVTAGGVPMGEVDHRTMASRKCAGLHLAGEILDVEGRIGGFNFQWAWATGYLAGNAAAGESAAAGA
jgi:predicted Rossmann fold flavoprotein